MSQSIETAVASHYARPELLQAILDGLRRQGKDPGALVPDDLAAVDEFHTGGRKATLKALSRLALETDMHVLDAGCGIGGTSRHIAHAHGCRVSGIDLTPDYIETARDLTTRTGLSDRCRFELGSATDTPYADNSFDAAISFHVAMNIEDRGRLYAELARVLKPGATLCLFDVMKGPVDGMRYPVPWASTAGTSFLKTLAETCLLLESAGFEIVETENLRLFAIDFFDRAFAKNDDDDELPPLGLHILTGAGSPEKFRNFARALADHQVEPVIVIARLTG
jgi:ubiquinone/menaquinone biosynthesis C-methylase UbiE